MSELILINLILIFIFISLYVSFTFSQELSKKDTFYGIYLEEKYKTDALLRAISKNFKLQSFFIFLITSSVSLLLINIKKDFQNPLFVSIPLFTQIILYFAVYIHAFKKVKSFKTSHIHAVKGQHQKTVIDTEFIKEKNSLKRLFIYFYSIPLFITIGLSLYTFFHYETIPNEVPSHWNYLGEIDAWVSKSYASVLLPSLMQIGLIILLALVTMSVFTSRVKLSADNLEQSKANTLKYLKGIALSIYLITIFMVVLFGEITTGILQGSNLKTSFLWINLIGPLIGIIIMLYSFFKYGDKSFLKDKSNGSYSPEDNDDYWLWGFLYNNPNDPAIMVQKRYGLGWTLNVGNKKGKLILIVLFLFIIGNITLSFFYS